MTNVLVCVKRVPDSSSEVVLTEDAQAVDGRYAGFTMSPHEECAVELAVQVTAATGGEAAVLTLGDADAVEQLRSALAVGATAATLVEAEPSTFGPADVAREIAAVVRAHEAEGSTPRPGAARQRRRRQRRLPGRDPARLRAPRPGRQRREGGLGRRRRASPPRSRGPTAVETYRVPLPAVVTIREGGVEPRYPSVPGRMKAKKVAVEERTPTRRADRPEAGEADCCPRRSRRNVQILGEGAAAAPAVVDLFEELGVLSR